MNKQELNAYISGLGLPDFQPSKVADEKYIVYNTSGEHAEAAWRVLREQVDTTLHWPIICGSDRDGDTPDDTLELAMMDEFDPKAIISAALDLNLEEYFDRRVGADEEYYGPALAETPPKDMDDEAPSRPFLFVLGSKKKPEELRKHQWATIRNPLTSQFSNRVHILLAPTAIPWEVAAYINFGNWNECPPPHVQVALHKKWFEKWHAEPFAMTHDILEMHIRNPVRSMREAWDLAREQYVYCADIVDQGCESIIALAQEIKNCDGWYFWWD